jgi:gentisate 1,2-dioxygenase
MRCLWTSIFGAALLFSCVATGAQVATQQPTATPGYRQLVPGLLTRSRFAAQAAGGRRIELWDLLVGPGRRSGDATLPGAAVFEVRGGTGRIVIDGKEQELRSGATLPVPERASFQLINTRTDLGLSIRATVIVGAR